MLVRVLSDPFSVPREDLEDIAVAAMQGHNAGPKTTFSATPTERMRAGYSVVLGFDLPASYGPRPICAEQTSEFPTVESDRTRLFMVFCEGADWLTWVQASIPRIASPNEPLFREMVAQATFALIPLADDRPVGAGLMIGGGGGGGIGIGGGFGVLGGGR